MEVLEGKFPVLAEDVVVVAAEVLEVILMGVLEPVAPMVDNEVAVMVTMFQQPPETAVAAAKVVTEPIVLYTADLRFSLVRLEDLEEPEVKAQSIRIMELTATGVPTAAPVVELTAT